VAREGEQEGDSEEDGPALNWYTCTRHTYASLYVLAGGSIEKLPRLMGHSDNKVTQRYAHLRPDLFEARTSSGSRLT
jgi:hypothetical protein